MFIYFQNLNLSFDIKKWKFNTLLGANQLYQNFSQENQSVLGNGFSKLHSLKNGCLI
jgi:hypothetical protein